MKKKIIIGIYIISIIIVLLSLSKLFYSDLIKYPEFGKIENVQIVELNNETLRLSLAIETFNPNSFSQKITDGNFSIFENNANIGSANIIKGFSIEPDTSGIVEMDVNLKTIELSKIVSEKKKYIEVNLLGEIDSKVLFFDISPTINLPYRLNIFEILTNCLEDDSKNQKIVKINSTTINHISLGKTNATTTFTFLNPYKLEFTLESYPCKIYFNNNYAGDGNVLKSINIRNGQKQAKGQFKFVLNNFNLSESLLQNFLNLNTKWDYETKGTLNLQILGYNISIPYNYQGELIR